MLSWHDDVEKANNHGMMNYGNIWYRYALSLSRDRQRSLHAVPDERDVLELRYGLTTTLRLYLQARDDRR